MKKVNEYISYTNHLKSSNIVLKYSLVVSLFLSVILSGIVLYNTIRGPFIVEKDMQGLPVPLSVSEERLADIATYETFLSDFLIRLYSWDKDTYILQVNKVYNYMSPLLKEDFIRKIEKDKTVESIKKDKIVSSIVIDKINPNVKKEKNTYTAEVDAIRYRVTDFISRVNPVTFYITFQPSRINRNNVYGLEVVSFEEFSRGELIPEQNKGE